jgi:hypothetical protein
MYQPWGRRCLTRGILRFVVEEVDYGDFCITNQGRKSSKSIETEFNVMVELFQNTKLVSAQLETLNKMDCTTLVLVVVHQEGLAAQSDRLSTFLAIHLLAPIRADRKSQNQCFPVNSSPGRIHRHLLTRTGLKLLRSQKQLRSWR